MQHWNSIRDNITGFASTASQQAANAARNADVANRSAAFQSSFANFAQSIRERTGAADGEDITELPQEYRDLERRVDSLASAYRSLLKIARVYETEPYDYPTQINESISELSKTASNTITTWTRLATKGTLLPQPDEPQSVPTEHIPKTLSHALSISSQRAAADLASNVEQAKLAAGLKSYAGVQDQIGSLRLKQDQQIVEGFLEPWYAQLNGPIATAQKSAAAVTQSRLTLDAVRATLKGAAPNKQERLRLEVEAAEERLVNTTEDAISQMRNVLESPEAVKALAKLIKAQQAYHAQAAESLQRILADAEEAGVQAEAEYRKARSQ